MSEEKNWHLIYTRPKMETMTARLLLKKRLEVFCPLKKIIRHWVHPKKLAFEPLFTSHLFVYCSEKDYCSVKATAGVINFAHWLGEPAIIDHEEVNTIKGYLNGNFNLTVEKIPVNPQDIVSIVNGPVMQIDGRGMTVRQKCSKILLPSLGYALIATAKINVEVAKTVKGFRFTIKD